MKAILASLRFPALAVGIVLWIRGGVALETPEHVAAYVMLSALIVCFAILAGARIRL